MGDDRLSNLIHIGKIVLNKGTIAFLILRKVEQFQWFKLHPFPNEEPLKLSATTVEEALRMARKEWKDDSFRFIHCGFRYTLPARDCVGTPALFFQMKHSYETPNGIYFDKDVGHNCFVDNASREALDLMRALKRLP